MAKFEYPKATKEALDRLNIDGAKREMAETEKKYLTAYTNFYKNNNWFQRQGKVVRNYLSRVVTSNTTSALTSSSPELKKLQALKDEYDDARVVYGNKLTASARKRLDAKFGDAPDNASLTKTERRAKKKLVEDDIEKMKNATKTSWVNKNEAEVYNPKTDDETVAEYEARIKTLMVNRGPEEARYPMLAGESPDAYETRLKQIRQQEKEAILARYERLIRFNEVVAPGAQKQYEAKTEALEKKDKNLLQKGASWAVTWNQKLEKKCGTKGAKVVRAIATTGLITGVAALAGTFGTAGVLGALGYGGWRFSKALGTALIATGAGETMGKAYEKFFGRRAQQKAEKELREDSAGRSMKLSRDELDRQDDKRRGLIVSASERELARKKTLVKVLTAIGVGGGITAADMLTDTTASINEGLLNPDTPKAPDAGSPVSPTRPRIGDFPNKNEAIRDAHEAIRDAKEAAEVPETAYAKAGDGVSQVVKRQLEADPELAQELGYDTNWSETKKANFFNKLMKDTGYIKADGTEQVRIDQADLDRGVAYKLSVVDGKPLIAEHVDGKPTGEVHALGTAFEGKDIDSYERIWKRGDGRNVLDAARGDGKDLLGDRAGDGRNVLEGDTAGDRTAGDGKDLLGGGVQTDQVSGDGKDVLNEGGGTRGDGKDLLGDRAGDGKDLLDNEGVGREALGRASAEALARLENGSELAAIKNMIDEIRSAPWYRPDMTIADMPDKALRAKAELLAETFPNPGDMGDMSLENRWAIAPLGNMLGSIENSPAASLDRAVSGYLNNELYEAQSLRQSIEDASTFKKFQNAPLDEVGGRLTKKVAELREAIPAPRAGMSLGEYVNYVEQASPDALKASMSEELFGVERTEHSTTLTEQAGMDRAQDMATEEPLKSSKLSAKNMLDEGLQETASTEHYVIEPPKDVAAEQLAFDMSKGLGIELEYDEAGNLIKTEEVAFLVDRLNTDVERLRQAYDASIAGTPILDANGNEIPFEFTEADQKLNAYLSYLEASKIDSLPNETFGEYANRVLGELTDIVIAEQTYTEMKGILDESFHNSFWSFKPSGFDSPQWEAVGPTKVGHFMHESIDVGELSLQTQAALDTFQTQNIGANGFENALDADFQKAMNRFMDAFPAKKGETIAEYLARRDAFRDVLEKLSDEGGITIKDADGGMTTEEFMRESVQNKIRNNYKPENYYGFLE